jgi:hypothetical protein
LSAISYFNINYLNLVKYNYSTIGKLKILFERNNKFKLALSNLGNVFKNSKWSNFKNQNIKESLIKSWVFVFLLILLTILVFFSNKNFLGLLFFVNYFLDTINEILFIANEYLEYFFALIGVYYLVLFFNIKCIFYGEQKEFVATFFNQQTKQKKINNVSTTKLNFSLPNQTSFAINF